MHQVDVLDFVLNHDKFGLSNIDGYGLKLFDMFLGDYGLPHQQWRVHIILVEEQCGGATAAHTAVRLAKAFGQSVLPQGRVHELLFPAGDSRLEDVTRKLQKHPTGYKKTELYSSSAQNKGLEAVRKQFNLSLIHI